MGRYKPAKHKVSDAERPKPDTTKQSHDGDNLVAPVAKIPPSPTYYEQPNKRQEDKTPRWKKILEIGALVLALIVAVIYGGQLYVMSNQLGEMAKSRVQGERQFTVSQRPWVGIDGPITLTKIIPGEHTKIEYSTKIKNFGNSPALTVIPRVDVVVGQRSTDITPILSKICGEIDKTLVPLKVGEVIFPTDSFTFPTGGTPDLSSWKIPSSNTDPVYFFAGCIAYVDATNKLHHTQVCQWTDKDNFTVGAKFSSCSRPFVD